MKAVSKFQKIKGFIFPILSGIKINLGGQLALSEIYALSDSLSIKKWKKLFTNLPDLKLINLAYIIFLVAQITSDIFNQSSFENSSKGWANIIMAIFVTNFLAKNLLVTNGEFIIYFFFGDIIRLLIWTPVETEGLSFDTMQFYKFRMAPMLNNLVLIISFILYKRVYLKNYIFLILVGYGLLNMGLDYRSNGLFFILTAILYHRRVNFQKIRMQKLFIYLILFGLIFQGLYTIYVSEVLNGNIGGKHSLIQMQRIENPYNPLNLIITGRAETVASLSAISDKPIFGHGSWALDPGGKYTFLTYKLHQEEEKFEERMAARKTDPIIPSHSVLLGAWVTAGIFGFFSILYLLILIIRRAFIVLRSSTLQKSAFFPILIFFILSTFWNILFSPLSHIKLTLPIMIACIIYFYQKEKNINKNSLLNKRLTYETKIFNCNTNV